MNRQQACLAIRGLIVPILLALAAHSAQAENDLSGEWGTVYFEDYPERLPGPEAGDYLGLPINDAARLRGESWSASLITVPEHQCTPHPAPYVLRGPSNMTIYKDLDIPTQRVTAYHFSIEVGPYRVVYMDGRPHPVENTRHTWEGFSTGKWERNVLVVTTTHLKAGYIRRNGIPHSDQTTLLEYFTRYGNYLTYVSIVNDPVYLTEPLVRSTNWILSPGNRLRPAPCRIAIEIVRPAGEIPHYYPGENDILADFGNKFGLPPSATRGGAVTMYPEFALQLEGLSPGAGAGKK